MCIDGNGLRFRARDDMRGVAEGMTNGQLDSPRRSPMHDLTMMSFTEEPTRVWEVGEPLPLEIPEHCHEPDVPELEPAHR